MTEDSASTAARGGAFGYHTVKPVHANGVRASFSCPVTPCEVMLRNRSPGVALHAYQTRCTDSETPHLGRKMLYKESDEGKRVVAGGTGAGLDKPVTPLCGLLMLE